jgi:hypothetical protein
LRLKFAGLGKWGLAERMFYATLVGTASACMYSPPLLCDVDLPLRAGSCEARPRRCGSTASAFLQTRPRRAWNGEVRSHGQSARNCDGAGVRVGIGDEAGDEISLDDEIDAIKVLCDVDVSVETAVVVLELESAGLTKFRVIPVTITGTKLGLQKSRLQKIS